MDEAISAKLSDTQRVLLEHFDEEVHARLKLQLDDARAQLDRIGRLFWNLSQFVLKDYAEFDDESLSFHLRSAPEGKGRPGTYRLISKGQPNIEGEFLYRLSHPLGEWAIGRGKESDTPVAKVTFDVTHYPTKVSVVEQLKGKSGVLTLQLLIVDSFDREEYLLFTSLDETGNLLEQEVCQKLFQCAGMVSHSFDASEELMERLEDEAVRHTEAAIARSLEANSHLFNEERERLEKWADDLVVAAEKDLADTKAQLKVLKRQARQASSMEEQRDLQSKIRDLEKKQRRQRQQIFDVEDEIAERRDRLLDDLERQMKQQTKVQHLFTIQWTVI